jgi:thiol-disulfide isomerase/thioredoxin
MTRFTLTAACVAAFSLAYGCVGSDTTDTQQQTKPDEGPFVPTTIALRADGELIVGKTVQLKVIGTNADGSEREITENLTFASSDERVATVDADGLATVHKRGPVSFSATNTEFSLDATWDVTPTCEYPEFAAQLQYNRVMPPLSWPAKWPDGSDFEFSLENVYCDLDWQETKTIAFVLSAGWCTPCTLYAQRLEGEVAELNALGMEVVIIEVQNVEGALADLAFAYSHVNRITNTIPGIVAGDKDTKQVFAGESFDAAGFLEDSAILRAFPSVFVVRTTDMRIIADQNRADFYLPLADIAADPNADWSKSGDPVFENLCGSGDEEASEPNDVPDNAAPITAGVHTGGICADGPDLYRIDIEGDWTIQLDFEHEVGDLDIFVWDTGRDQPAQQDGQVIGSATSNNQEKFDHSGPAVIAVKPYQHASAPYTLTLTER